jgi:molybdenum cofactor synthesis domain-containing protein
MAGPERHRPGPDRTVPAFGGIGATELNLLDKTEVWIENIEIHQADLNEVASAAAGALGLEKHRVLVVDLRPGVLVFDILQPSVLAEQIAGKGEALLDAIGGVKGVAIRPDTTIHSEGILGLIALDKDDALGVVQRSQALGREVGHRVARRALVFASGSEVRSGQVKDTNTPYICDELEEHGYRVSYGGVLDDDAVMVKAALFEAASSGYGLVITTGGVGAEAKDCTIEGLELCDPGTASAWLVNYEVGKGRHAKPGVRIATGKIGITTVACLPGPNQEVRDAMPVLLDGLAAGDDSAMLAERIASRLRSRLRHKTNPTRGHDS